MLEKPHARAAVFLDLQGGWEGDRSERRPPGLQNVGRPGFSEPAFSPGLFHSLPEVQPSVLARRTRSQGDHNQHQGSPAEAVSRSPELVRSADLEQRWCKP